MVARPADADGLEVLSLRVGMALAERVEPLADGPVRVKWPNDLLVGGRKLAGVLVEVRWRDGRPEWAAVGVGLNVRPPHGFDDAAALAPGTSRVEALAGTIAALLSATGAHGPLAPAELAAFDRRDAVRGRRLVAPVRGRAAGITPHGALRVADDVALHELRQATVEYAPE
jgi:BirA family biotin operon repressor/biotin-[acetyl-CoA-carboxylase] ligase